MRTAFLALLLVNLMFLAWAEWIDVPAQPPNAIAALPRLQLASDPAAVGSAGVDGTHGMSAAQCLSIGPFNDETDLTRASSLLAAEHLPARERVVQGAPVSWYWVYLSSPGDSPGGTVAGAPAGVPNSTSLTAVQVAQVLHRLSAAGIPEAQLMSLGGTQEISLGLFQDLQLAQHQLQLAQQKGFPAVLAQRQISQPAYWLDLWVDGGTDTPALQAVKAEVGVPIGIQACPSGSDSLLAPGTQAVAPGIPAPEAVATPAPLSTGSPSPGTGRTASGAGIATNSGASQ